MIAVHNCGYYDAYRDAFGDAGTAGVWHHRRRAMASAREDGSSKCKCRGRWNACEFCFIYYIHCDLSFYVIYIHRTKCKRRRRHVRSSEGAFGPYSTCIEPVRRRVQVMDESYEGRVEGTDAVIRLHAVYIVEADGPL